MIRLGSPFVEDLREVLVYGALFDATSPPGRYWRSFPSACGWKPPFGLVVVPALVRRSCLRDETGALLRSTHPKQLCIRARSKDVHKVRQVASFNTPTCDLAEPRWSGCPVMVAHHAQEVVHRHGASHE